VREELEKEGKSGDTILSWGALQSAGCSENESRQAREATKPAVGDP
jgi:hypothetical protein